MSEFVNNMSSDSDSYSDSDYQEEFDYDEDEIFFDEDNSTFNVLSATIDNGDYQSFVDFTRNDNPRFRGRPSNPDNPADEGGEGEMRAALTYIPSDTTYYPLLHYILLNKGDRVKDKLFLTHIVNLFNEYGIDMTSISTDIFPSPCQHAINEDNGNDAEWTQLYRNLLSCSENASKKKRKTRKKSSKKKTAKKKSVKKKHKSAKRKHKQKSAKRKHKSAKKKTVNRRHRCTKKRFKMNQICATGSKKKMKKLAKYSKKIKMKLTKCSKKRIKNIK